MLNTQDRFFLLIIFLLGLSMVHFLGPILNPFLMAALLAYLTNPLINKLMRHKLSRLFSVIIVFLSLFSLIIFACLALVPFLESQLSTLLAKIPDMIAWTQTIMLPWLSDNMGISTASIDMDSLKSLIGENLTKAGGVTAYILKSIFHSGHLVLEWLMNILLIPVVTFYLMCDWSMILTNLQQLLPRRVEPTIVMLVKECDEVLSAFIRGQLLVMLSLAAIYATGLSLIGLQMGLLIGVIAGLLCIVPYLGFITGIITASIAAYVQFGSFSYVGMVIVVFLIGQSIEGMFLTPRLVGHRIGLHPVAVIFAILAGGSLFGFVGVLLALPTAAMLMVWLRYIGKRYHDSELYKA